MIKQLKKPSYNSEFGIGETAENVIEWAEYYSNIQEKLGHDEPLNGSEIIAIRLLLAEQSKAMLKNPKKYVHKKVGRPNAGTEARVQKYISILIRLNVAKNKAEAIKKTAKHFGMTEAAAEQASKGLDIKKLKNDFEKVKNDEIYGVKNVNN